MIVFDSLFDQFKSKLLQLKTLLLAIIIINILVEWIAFDRGFKISE